MTTYCDDCELPIDICACDEAKAYDAANPLVKPHVHKFELTPYTVGGCVIEACECGEEREWDVS